MNALGAAPGPGQIVQATCPACRGLFKVSGPPLPAAAPPPLPGPAGAPANAGAARWQVRKADGTTLTFPSLSVFQRFVFDGIISLDDEISRNGHTWRAITQIPELVGLFEVATARREQAIPPPLAAAPPPGPFEQAMDHSSGPPDLPVQPTPEMPPGETESFVAPRAPATSSPTAPWSPADIPNNGPASRTPADLFDEHGDPDPPFDNPEAIVAVATSLFTGESAEEEQPEQADEPEPRVPEFVPDAVVTAPDLQFAPDPPLEDAESLLSEIPADDFDEPPPVVVDLSDFGEMAAHVNPTEPPAEAPIAAETAPVDVPGTRSEQNTAPDMPGPELDFSPASTVDDQAWTPSFDDLSGFAPDVLPTGPQVAPLQAVADPSDSPDDVVTLRDFKMPADIQPGTPFEVTERELSLEEEMDLAGSTLEMKLPDQFELGPALDADLTLPESAANAAVHDPFALTLPEFQLAPPESVEEPVGQGPAEAVPSAPQLDPNKHIQPVVATRALVQPRNDVPLDSDETGELGQSGWVKAITWLVVLAVLGGGGWMAWLQFHKVEPTWAGHFEEAQAEVAPQDVQPEDPPAPTQPSPTEPVRRRQPEAEARPDVAAAGDPIPEKTPAEPKPSEPATPEKTKPEKTKPEKTKPEKTKPEKTKPEKTKPEKAKPEKAKPEKAKPEKAKPEKTKPEPEKTKPEPEKTPGNYDSLMTAGRKALKAGQGAKALKHFKQASAMNPRSVEPVKKQGDAFLRMGNATQAILKFQEALQMNPGYRGTYIGLGTALERAGRTQDAITTYRKYLRMCPNCSKAKAVRNRLMRLGAEP